MPDSIVSFDAVTGSELAVDEPAAIACIAQATDLKFFDLNHFSHTADPQTGQGAFRFLGSVRPFSADDGVLPVVSRTTMCPPHARPDSVSTPMAVRSCVVAVGSSAPKLCVCAYLIKLRATYGLVQSSDSAPIISQRLFHADLGSQCAGDRIHSMVFVPGVQGELVVTCGTADVFFVSFGRFGETNIRKHVMFVDESMSPVVRRGLCDLTATGSRDGRTFLAVSSTVWRGTETAPRHCIHLMSGSTDGLVCEFAVEDLSVPQSPVTTLRLLESGERDVLVVSGHANGSLKVWSASGDNVCNLPRLQDNGAIDTLSQPVPLRWTPPQSTTLSDFGTSVLLKPPTFSSAEWLIGGSRGSGLCVWPVNLSSVDSTSRFPSLQDMLSVTPLLNLNAELPGTDRRPGIHVFSGQSPFCADGEHDFALLCLTDKALCLVRTRVQPPTQPEIPPQVSTQHQQQQQQQTISKPNSPKRKGWDKENHRPALLSDRYSLSPPNDQDSSPLPLPSSAKPSAIPAADFEKRLCSLASRVRRMDAEISGLRTSMKTFQTDVMNDLTAILAHVKRLPS